MYWNVFQVNSDNFNVNVLEDFIINKHITSGPFY